MERSVAIKKLAKLLGKSFGYRVDPKAPSPEERAAASAAMPAAIAQRNKLNEQRDERYRAILAADAEYQSLKAAAKTAGDEVSKLSSLSRHYRITVGKTMSIFFSVEAEGDSWEDVIAKVEAKQKKKQTA